jgi:hypothetical protein
MMETLKAVMAQASMISQSLEYLRPKETDTKAKVKWKNLTRTTIISHRKEKHKEDVKKMTERLRLVEENKSQQAIVDRFQEAKKAKDFLRSEKLKSAVRSVMKKQKPQKK